MALVTIDPITRIEGHLRADVQVDGGVVTSAQVSGTMARGIEALLVGRDPRDATYVTERICGVCFGAHGWTSCLAVEQAHGTTQLPEAARLLRNLLVGACWLHDHPLHFYHLSALDYLDLTVLTTYTGDDPNIIQIRDLILNGTAGPLTPFYAPDAYSITDLNTVVMAVQHYLEALLMQAKAKKMSALLAGKQPHQSGMVVGGVTQLPDDATLNLFESMLTEQIDFINNVYVSDVVTLGTGPLLPLALSNVGVGHQNYLSYGGFPEGDGSFLYPEGAIVDGSLVTSSRADIEGDLSEDVTNSWYDSATGGHPSQTQQIFDLGSSGYSFVKAPRYDGNPMEVGPLARMMVAINRPDHPAYSHAATQTLIDLVVNQGVQPNAVARHAARALETQILCDGMVRWLDELRDMMANARPGRPLQIHDTRHWDPPTSPGDRYGVGMTEAPRGSLAHWVKIADNSGPTKVIDQYACVVPTTWNASPGNGPYEEALIGCPVPDEDNPINVVRIIRSFDPCIACAVHVITPKGDTKKYVVDI